MLITRVPASGRPEWQPEGEAFWLSRQGRLLSQTLGAQLTRAEVLAVERLEAIGERVIWIPVTRAAKTPDLIWLTRDGKPWELKSPDLMNWGNQSARQQYKTISMAISDDAPWKKRFLIDLGVESLTNELHWELRQYNRRHRQATDHQIQELIVMTGGDLNVILVT